jgi:hypothetical protein
MLLAACCDLVRLNEFVSQYTPLKLKLRWRLSRSIVNLGVLMSLFLPCEADPVYNGNEKEGSLN